MFATSFGSGLPRSSMTSDCTRRGRLFADRLLFVFFLVATALILAQPGFAAPPCTTLQVDENTMVEILCNRVKGMTPEQARCLMQQSFDRNACFTVGGSRVRGDCRLGSDLDVGFSGPDPLNPELDCPTERQIKRIIGNCGKCGPLSLEPTPIMPGYNPRSGCFDPIQSPEEFFSRCGVRSGGPRAGLPFGPSGSITCTPDGVVRIIPPPRRCSLRAAAGPVTAIVLGNEEVQGGIGICYKKFGDCVGPSAACVPESVWKKTECVENTATPVLDFVDKVCYPVTGLVETSFDPQKMSINGCYTPYNRRGWIDWKKAAERANKACDAEYKRCYPDGGPFPKSRPFGIVCGHCW